MKARCRDLGKMDYAACWELQRSLFEELLAKKERQRQNGADGGADGGAVSDEAGTVLLVEHPPVYTLGKSGLLHPLDRLLHVLHQERIVEVGEAGPKELLRLFYGVYASLYE